MIISITETIFPKTNSGDIIYLYEICQLPSTPRIDCGAFFCLSVIYSVYSMTLKLVRKFVQEAWNDS